MAPIQERVYDTPHGDIHYWVSVIQEHRPCLVFLPGLTADHHLFDKQVEFFQEKVNIFTWDAPAHGLSRPFSLKFTMDDIIHWLHDMLAAHGISRPVFVGQSLGGYISQFYMDEYRGSTAGFISIDSAPTKRSYYSHWELALMKHTEWMYLSIPWRLLIYWGVSGTAKSEYGRKLMKQTMESYEKREYCALADYGYRILVRAIEAGRTCDIECPVLLLCGEKDMAGSCKRYSRNWTKNEEYRLVWIPGAGHNSNTDAPDTVNSLIEEFITTIFSDCDSNRQALTETARRNIIWKKG